MKWPSLALVVLAGASCDLSGLGPAATTGSGGDGGTVVNGGGGSAPGGGGANAGGGGAGGSGGSGGESGSGGSAPRGWPDSATAFCSDGVHAVSCASAPGGAQDGSRTDLAKADYAYVDADLQTIEDKLTGLLWTAYPMGGGANNTWDDAPSVCSDLAASTFAGVGDWRLPSRLELTSLLDSGKPTIKLSGLFHVNGTGIFWSSTPSAASSDKAWSVYFVNGTPGLNDRTALGRVLCTSGELAPSVLVADAQTVSDPRTGLMWERNAGADSSDVDWAGARAYCQKLGTDRFAGFGSWRLPTAKELQTIVDDTKSAQPLIRDPISWPPGGSQHWSSTPTPEDPSMVFILVGAGTEYYGAASSKGSYLNARCVRSAVEP